MKNKRTHNPSGSFIISNHIAEPNKWDAEHPNLYKLVVDLYDEGSRLYSKTYSIGFREVEVVKNKLLVNGKEVHLRGANRHDIHPLLGRVSTKEYELKDVLLAKEANLNFIRTSHYPPTSSFLSYCDKYGIYVEDETAVCFVGTHRSGRYVPGNTASSPAHSGQYLSQLNEMIDKHRNHPSVIIWSIGNENQYGDNFLKSYELAKKKDTSRPVIFSYPNRVPDNQEIYDVLSVHYPPQDGNLQINNEKKIQSFGFEEMPVLYDEVLHLACYNTSTQKEDQNVRDFWGQSLDILWNRVYEADGALGCAIWGMIDETFMLPDTLSGFGESWGEVFKEDIPPPFAGHTVGYGESGIVDSWRRKKPEFWNTKKAYSPARILSDSLVQLNGRSHLILSILNRFDHTNINELKIEYIINGTCYNIKKVPSIEPHQKGILKIALSSEPDSSGILIRLLDKMGLLVDMYKTGGIEHFIPDDSEKQVQPVNIIRENKVVRIICSNGKELHFSTDNGLLQTVLTDGYRRKISGPYLNLKTKGEMINAFTTKINDFKVDGPADHLSWLKSGYWSIYPDYHLSRNKGIVSLFPEVLNKYRHQPEKEWCMDNKSFYYHGTSDEKPDHLVKIASSTKEKVWYYSLLHMDKPAITAIGIGDISCRLSKKDEMYTVSINHISDYVDLGWGAFQRDIMLEESYHETCSIQF